MSLCKYKSMFGAPGTGAHSIRLFDIAVVDVGLTIVAAWAISKHFNFDFIKTLTFLFVLGIVSHRVFCVQTTVDKLLFAAKNNQ